MHITTLEQNGVTVVNVVGKVEIATVGAMKKKIRDLIEDGVMKILLDVSGIQSVDSTGIGVLVALLNTARSKGGDLRLVCSFTAEVEEAFNLCGLARVFVQYPNVKDGIQHFNL